MTFADVALALGDYVLSAEEAPGLALRAQNLRRQFDPQVAAGHLHGQPMKLEIGFLDDPSFNAWASSDGKSDYIGINSGVPWIAQGMARLLLSHSELLPGLGTPMSCTPRVFPELTAIPNNANWWPNDPLECPVRDAFAVLVADGAVFHTASHELAHIFNGHVDYLQDHCQLTRLSENDPDVREGLLRQTLEWDADLSATNATLGLMLAPRVELVNGRGRWHLEGTGLQPSRSLSIGAAVLSSSIFDAMFSNFAEILSDAALTSTHPPPFYRAFYHNLQICHVLQVRAHIPFEESIATIHTYETAPLQALARSFPGLKIIAGIEQSEAEHGADWFTKASGFYLERYTSEWRRIHPELDRLKRGGILAAPEPTDEPI